MVIALVSIFSWTLLLMVIMFSGFNPVLRTKSETNYCKINAESFLFFRCMVKVTGDITVSFPASVLPLIYDVENAPMLSFLVRGTSCLEQILPNKALINRYAMQQFSMGE